MAKKTLTDEELLAQFDDISAAKASTSRKPKPADSSKPTGKDPLADLEELESLAKAPVRTSTSKDSRPNTPKLSSLPPRSSALAAGSTASGRNSEDKTRPLVASGRRSGESAGEESTTVGGGSVGVTPPSSEGDVATVSPVAPPAGSGWWGGIVALGSAAVKQANQAVKEIQQNEEALRWAEQVRGNVVVLRDFGGELRSRALPTFTNILHTLAPPIASHERLQIHITHDLVGYPSLDPTVHAVFSRVMNQVEGGDLLVIQRGSEARVLSPSSPTAEGFAAQFRSAPSVAGWGDGPWWRDSLVKRDMSFAPGLVEGSKLAKVNAETFATEYYAPRGGIDAAIYAAAEPLNESNPTRSSDIFVAVQAIAFDQDEGVFGPNSAAAAAAREQKAQPAEGSGMIEDVNGDEDRLVCFAIYLHDPVHHISFRSITQGLPRRWAEWLDAENDPEAEMQLPPEIADIVAEGGIDPREWISEWVEESIGLGVGVVAQRYVARRMGVGEGGVGRGKGKDIAGRKIAVESGAGELARAV